uniref:PHD finger protein 2 n=1 Tax=Magallana gigas TaxID=29159 RepID=K1R0E9_MAGGI
MVTRSRIRVAPETSQQLQASKSNGRTRQGGKRKRYGYYVCKTRTPVGLMVQCDQCKDWFHPSCVGRGDEEVRELSTYYCPDCTLLVE